MPSRPTLIFQEKVFYFAQSIEIQSVVCNFVSVGNRGSGGQRDRSSDLT